MKDQNFQQVYQQLDQSIHALHIKVINYKKSLKEMADFLKGNLIFKNLH